jgi:hypothetical protein
VYTLLRRDHASTKGISPRLGGVIAGGAPAGEVGQEKGDGFTGPKEDLVEVLYSENALRFRYRHYAKAKVVEENLPPPKTYPPYTNAVYFAMIVGPIRGAAGHSCRAIAQGP